MLPRNWGSSRSVVTRSGRGVIGRGPRNGELVENVYLYILESSALSACRACPRDSLGRRPWRLDLAWIPLSRSNAYESSEPDRRRRAVVVLQQRFRVSQRRACRVAEQSRSMQRRPPRFTRSNGCCENGCERSRGVIRSGGGARRMHCAAAKVWSPITNAHNDSGARRGSNDRPEDESRERRTPRYDRRRQRRTTDRRETTPTTRQHNPEDFVRRLSSECTRGQQLP